MNRFASVKLPSIIDSNIFCMACSLVFFSILSKIVRDAFPAGEKNGKTPYDGMIFRGIYS